jgi:uncharacterized protein (TIGR03437 family)
MSKLHIRNVLVAIALAFPAVALADITGTPTLTSGSTLSLDTGTVGTGTTGDISWNGTSISVVGSAVDVDIASTPLGSAFSGQSGYGTLVTEGSALISQYASQLSSYLTASAITPKVNDILIVKTNGGNYAGLLVTAISGTSISLEFDTFVTSTSTPTGPKITSVVNNYSFIPTGFSNSGIAPGTIFLIFGSDLANAPAGNVTLSSSANPGIPKTLAGASISVTVGGTTVSPAMYYATPTQIAAVLPSNTPTGSATITVTYNNTASNAFSFQVVPYALGLDTYYGTGGGLLTATNTTNGAVFSYTSSAKPGETIVLWASGLGADTADSDTLFTTTPHPVATPLKIYFGGVEGTILYAGSSGYPGLDQIDVTIPDDAPTGCYVGVVAVTGSGSSLTASNFGSLAIDSAGGQCNDSIFGISGTTISTLSGQSSVSYGDVFVGQLVGPAIPPQTGTTTTNFASASFSKETGSAFGSSSNAGFSIGSCSVSEIVSATGGGTVTSTGLDAGSISLAGPEGNYNLTKILAGTYDAALPSNAIPSSGGAFTFTGAGGSGATAVGSFKATVNLPNPLLSWTNQSAAATINRAQGVQVTWTGGGSGTYVIITGQSSNSATGASGTFTCLANQSALSFTVPGYVTLTLPAGNGSMDVENTASYGTFTASGLDFGTAFGFTGTSVSSVYQ